MAEPRAEAQKIRKTSAETKASSGTQAVLDKYAPPPPDTLTDPAGRSYAVGPKLGKGGFAICYEASAESPLQKRPSKVALKIVKTKMPTKVEEKVREPIP